MIGDDYKLWSCVSIATSSSLDGRSTGESERQTMATLIAISISSSSPSSPKMLLSSASFGSPDCCICRSHLARPPRPASPKKKGSVGSLPVSSTPRIMPRAYTSLLSVYLHHQMVEFICDKAPARASHHGINRPKGNIWTQSNTLLVQKI